MEEPGRLQCLGSLESDTTEWLPFHFSLSCIGEGNGNPLQCSCLENPRDGKAWWAAVYGVAQSQTRLRRLSSSSSNFQGKIQSNAASAKITQSLELWDRLESHSYNNKGEHFLNLFFNWRKIASQCCVGSCYTTTQISHNYTYIPSLLSLPPIPHHTHLDHHRVPGWALPKASISTLRPGLTPRQASSSAAYLTPNLQQNRNTTLFISRQAAQSHTKPIDNPKHATGHGTSLQRDKIMLHPP